MSKRLSRILARRPWNTTTDIPPRLAALIVLLASLPMLAGAWFVGLREDVAPQPLPVSPSAEMMRAEQTLHANYRIFPNSNSRLAQANDTGLVAGSWMPSLVASGWLNGAPDASDLNGKVLVVDVWDGLCPYCSLAAPALIEANAKYHDRGVVFVGLTTANADESQQYVDHWQIPWANGYNAEATIDALKADAPTLFVVGPKGRVLWNDGQARSRHDIGALSQQLEHAIEDALARHPATTGDSDTL